MNLKVQKQLAAKVLGVAPSRVVFDSAQLATIKEALTRSDIRDLVNSNIIHVKQIRNQSHFHAKINARQKSRGLRKGPGSRKGSAGSRLPAKDKWMSHVRLQRTFLKSLRDNESITTQVYRQMYAKVKANLFKSRSSLKLYMQEHALFAKK